MAKSLPPVSAKVIADAEQFIQEFRRAERAAEKGRGKIAVEVDKLQRDVSKKFSAGKFGADVLKGLGIGSGFALAQTAAEMIAGHWREAAEAAQRVEAASDRQLKATLELLRLRRSEPEQLEDLRRTEARLRRELEELGRPKTVTRTVGGQYMQRTETVGREATAAEVERSQEIAAQLQELAVQIEAMTQKATRDSRAGLKALGEQMTRDAEAKARAYMGFWDELQKSRAEHGEKLAREEEALQRQAEAYLRLADPMREYRQQLEEILRLQRQGALSGAQAGAATEALQAAKVDDMLKDFFGDMDRRSAENMKELGQVSDAAREMGWAFQSAFEDAIIQGEKFSDVLQGLAQDIMRMALRSAITQPLGNWIGGMFSGVFGGGKAAGGPVEAGKTYVVGEKGPEIFAPASAGTIIPNHRLGAAAPAGRAGGTYYIDARGADRTGLARLEAMIRAIDGSIEHRSVAAVADFRRRGAAMA